MVKRVRGLLLVLSVLLAAGCGGELSVRVVDTPEAGASATANLLATVEAAVAATLAAEAQPPAPSRTLRAMEAAATEPPPPAATATAMPAAEAPSGQMAPGTFLFLKTRETVTGTKRVELADLYALAGGDVTLIAPLPDRSCSLSPDGTMVASHGFGPGGEPLQVIRRDPGGGAAAITPYPIPDPYTRDSQRDLISVYWSPDNTRLALRTSCSLYVLTLATAELVEIWHECHAQVVLHKGIMDAAWSPDGAWIAFTVVNPSAFPSSNREDDLHGGHPSKLRVASADGATHVLLDEHGSLPVWSPDGRRLLYAGGWRKEGDGDVYFSEKLYAAGADGSGRVQLAETMGGAEDAWTDAYHTDLGWSEDGQRVYFRQGRPEGPGQLSTVLPDGTGPVNLGGEETFRVNYWPESGRITWLERADQPDSQPAWLRDQVAFVSDLDGADTIQWDQGRRLGELWSCDDHVVWRNDAAWFVARPDGSERRALAAEGGGTEDAPFFSPDCTQVVIAPWHVLAGALDHLAIIDLASGAQVQSLAAGPGEELRVLGWVLAEW